MENVSIGFHAPDRGYDGSIDLDRKISRCDIRPVAARIALYDVHTMLRYHAFLRIIVPVYGGITLESVGEVCLYSGKFWGLLPQAVSKSS